MQNYNLKEGVVLKDHQPAAIEYGLTHHYSINADCMGLGKSLESLAVVTASGLKTLVVCPAYLKENWKSEVLTFTNLKPQIVKDPRNFVLEKDTDIIISSYSQLKYTRHLFMEVRCVISDESHYLCSIDSFRAQTFHEYIDGSKPERMLLLSGTPIKNRISEYYSLLVLCSYNPRGTSGLRIFDKYRNYYSYLNHFSIPNKVKIGGRSITKYEGNRNVKELKKYLEGKFIRRLAKDSKPIYKNVYISFESDPKAAKLWSDFLENPRSLHISTRKKESAFEKAAFTVKYVENLVNEVGSCIVFSDHVDSTERIGEGLGSKARVITGSVPADERAKLVKEFQEGKFPVLVATIGAASTGFTLTRAWNMVFNDLSFVGANNRQAMKRIDRIGQTRGCVYHSILGSPEDKQINKTIMKKESHLKEIYDE